MSSKDLAEKLIQLLGGKENIISVNNCMTRLRVQLVDPEIVRIEEIKKSDGVLGVVFEDTIQIVLGPGKVNQVAEEVCNILGVKKGEVIEEIATTTVADLAGETKQKYKKQNQTPFKLFLRKIGQRG